MSRAVVCILIVVSLGILTVHAQDTTGQDYFADARVTNPTPFVGQQITYVFQLYDAVGLNSPLYKPSDFEGFWRVDLRDISQQAQQLNGRQYTVSEVKTALYPTRSGSIDILPSSVVLSSNVFQSQRELKANPVTVHVQPLPNGAPPGFSGAVGQFQMSATLDRQSVALGEPIALRVTISGTGNVERLPFPSALSPQTWRSYENPVSYSAIEQNGIIIGNKVYELLIFPDQAGVQSLPSLTLSYFDPGALAYRSVSTASVQIEVLPSNGSEPNTGDPAPSSLQGITLKRIPASLQIDGENSDFALWLLWFLPSLMIFATWGWRRYQQRFAQERRTSRQSQALQLAYGRLDIVRNSASVAAKHQLKEAILGYIADKLMVERANLDWQQEVFSQHIPQPLSNHIQSCIELADQGLYTPASEVHIKTLVDRVANILADIDQKWITS